MHLSNCLHTILWACCLISLPAGCTGTQHPPELATPPPAAFAPNDREPLPLARMICMADLIVFGLVESVGADSYRFHVETQVWGNEQQHGLTVEQYIPGATDDPRTAPYEVGQQFLLFLQYNSNKMRWKILGAGGEGELPVENGYVYFPGRAIDGLERKRYTVQRVEQEMPRYEYDTFLAAVKDFKSCFVYTYNTAGGRSFHLYQRRCPDEAIAKWQDATFMHRYLMHHMR